MKKDEILTRLNREDRNPYGLVIAIVRSQDHKAHAVIGMIEDVDAATSNLRYLKLRVPGREDFSPSYQRILDILMPSRVEMSMFRLPLWFDRVSPDEYFSVLEMYLHIAPQRETLQEVCQWFCRCRNEFDWIQIALLNRRWVVVVKGRYMPKGADITLYVDGVGAITFNDDSVNRRDLGMFGDLEKRVNEGRKILRRDGVREWKNLPLQDWATAFGKVIRVVVYDNADTSIGIKRIGEETFYPAV